MDIEEIKKKLEYIKTIAKDDEGAHGEEDNLWKQVLEAIANGAEEAPRLAAEALKTRNINFRRWCA